MIFSPGEIIRLEEHEEIQKELELEDVRYLKVNFSNRIGLSPTGFPDIHLLKSGSSVGFIKLPSSRTIQIVPKMFFNFESEPTWGKN